MKATGTFEITTNLEPPYEVVDGVSFGRATFQKKFEGPLSATGQVHMLGARTAVPNSAGYVALERIRGSLEGREGTFALLHTGLMDRGALSLSVVVIADSATGQLAGLRGHMQIRVVEGKHHYELEYELP
jgi:Protein of unknown function (DUF3224)